jgi:carbon monoxide dehydrogenase subunit G
MQISRTVEVDTPLDKVFAYLSDFTTTTEWDPGSVRTVKVSGDGGVGTTYHNTSEFNGRETELVYEVTELVEGERFALRGENKTIIARDTMEFAETAGGGSRVTYTADFTFKGLAKLIAPFLGGAFKKLGDEAERGLREHLGKL